MKRIISGLALLINISAFGQIKVIEDTKTVEIGKVGNFAATFLWMDKIDNTYTIHYQDTKFKQLTEYKEFSFKDEKGAFDNLYKMIIDGFDNPPKEDVKLELPNDLVYLHFVKSMGVVSLQISSTNINTTNVGLSSYMTKKQVMKLFGKN